MEHRRNPARVQCTIGVTVSWKTVRAGRVPERGESEQGARGVKSLSLLRCSKELAPLRPAETAVSGKPVQ